MHLTASRAAQQLSTNLINISFLFSHTHNTGRAASNKTSRFCFVLCSLNYVNAGERFKESLDEIPLSLFEVFIYLWLSYDKHFLPLVSFQLSPISSLAVTILLPNDFILTTTTRRITTAAQQQQLQMHCHFSFYIHLYKILWCANVDCIIH